MGVNCPVDYSSFTKWCNNSKTLINIFESIGKTPSYTVCLIKLSYCGHNGSFPGAAIKWKISNYFHLNHCVVVCE